MVVEIVEPRCLFRKFLYVTRARKADKNRQNTLFLLKRMIILPDKQLFINAPFQSAKYGKKCMENKEQETIGDVFCPTFRNQKSVYSSTKKTSSFCDCKKCKTYCHVLNMLFRDQKSTGKLESRQVDEIMLDIKQETKSTGNNNKGM